MRNSKVPTQERAMAFPGRSSGSVERPSREAASVAGVAVSHPDKIWWPEEHITKLDVVRFYDDIAPRLLPWMKDRPLTAERCPDGMRGECFFQKDFRGALPTGVPTKPITAESTGKKVHYVIGGSRRTLLALVNLGCIAVHVMNCRTRSLNQPDWLAFDLDPGSGEFADAARVGAVLGELLQELGLHAYPKTSGGRGLHVLVPLQGHPTQDRVRSFAVTVARTMAQRLPRLATVEMSKAKRGGRVFIDTLRNAFGQTMAAPYSVRRRASAPVSTPLDWDEVDERLDPARYNIRTIGRRLARTDPWADFWKHRQLLPEIS